MPNWVIFFSRTDKYLLENNAVMYYFEGEGFSMADLTVSGSKLAGEVTDKEGNEYRKVEEMKS